MRINSAVGLDQIPPHFLRALATPLSPVIAALVNRCVLEGVYPKIWKRSRVTPIPKIPGTQSVIEFRPITILPTISKLMEKWILYLLEDYLFTNSHQFGFKAGSGTEDAIGYAQFCIGKALASCTGVKKAAVISLDVAKAFDRCPFALILRKLEQRSVPVPILRLLQSYFKDRTQLVRVGQSCSKEYAVPSGIGQGSLLGPSIFNVFIDDVFSQQWSSDLELIGYADDILVIAPIATVQDRARLQVDLNKIEQLYQSIGLKLNAQKSKTLLVAISRNVNFEGIYFTLQDQPLPVVADLRYLGVSLNQGLSFDGHVEEVVSRGKRTLGALFASCRGLPVSTLRYIYKVKILPVLLYALPVACPTSKRSWLLLERLNRFACRLLANDYSSSYSDLLRVLKLSSIQNICVRRQLLLVYRYVYGLRNFPGQFFLRQSNPHYSLRRHSHSKQVEIPETATIAALPLYVAFRIWNLLDINENSVHLDFPLFRLHLRQVGICYYIYQRMAALGCSRYYCALDTL